jgi:dTDP-4-dehydrorhamnose 3,5-epimerase
LRFIETELAGAYVLELDRHVDERGFFARIWCRDELADLGLSTELAQCSISRNGRAGTLRGLHFQRDPHEEVKLVRSIRGAIYDVIVDLRPSSPTRGRWIGVELDAAYGRSLYVPQGFAHGFQTLVDETDVLYMISTPHAPEAAAGLRWDDPFFQIEWPETPSRTIGERDRGWPDFDPSAGSDASLPLGARRPERAVSRGWADGSRRVPHARRRGSGGSGRRNLP